MPSIITDYIYEITFYLHIIKVFIIMYWYKNTFFLKLYGCICSQNIPNAGYDQFVNKIFFFFCHMFPVHF